MVTLADIPTPALVLDRERLDRNLVHMAERCRALGVTLRPHVKTHKCIEIAERQRDLGAEGITVSTLYEAAVFADHGFEDVTWAFPVIPSQLDGAVALAGRIRLGVTVDSALAVDLLEQSGVPFPVWIKIDCGYHRAGMDPGAAATLDLARRLAASPTLHLEGVLTHSGHAYDAYDIPERRSIAEQERRAVAELRAQLADEGIEAKASVGSTPAMSVVASLDGVTEARPGNYAFYDGTQVALGSCTAADCGVTVVASVVSARPDAQHVMTDAGALALSKDPGPDRGHESMGRIYADYAAGTLRDDVWVAGLSQEHGKVHGSLSYGERVRILPNHSCLTVACFDEYFVVRGEDVVDRWKIWRGR